MASSTDKTAIPAETPVFYASRLIDSALQTLSNSSSSGSIDAGALKQLKVARSLLANLDPYLDEHSSYPAYLEPLLKATATHDWAGAYSRGDISVKLDPHFSAGPYEGAWIGQFAKAVHAKKVLEVGMFTGTTTLAIAENLASNQKDAGGEAVHVTTLELFDYLKTFVTPHFEKAGHGKDRITVVVGKANESMEKLLPNSASSDDVPATAKGPYDLIFIDADKPGYEGYYNQIMGGGLLKKTGTMLIDNTLYKVRLMCAPPFTRALLTLFDYRAPHSHRAWRSNSLTLARKMQRQCCISTSC